MFKWHSFLAATLMLGGSAAWADTYTPTHNFTPGTAIQSSQVNANFIGVGTVVNGNLDNSNLKSAAAIALTKLDLTQELPILRSAALRCISVGTTGDTVPRCAMMSGGSIQFGAGGGSALDMLIKREDANTIAIRDAGDTAYKILKCSVISPTTIINSTVGGTGADLSAKTQGSVPYFSATGVLGNALAPVATKLIGFDGAGTGLTTYPISVGFGGSGSDGTVALGNATFNGPMQKNYINYTQNAGSTLTCDTLSPVIINCSGTATVDGAIAMTASGSFGGIGGSANDYAGNRGAGLGGGDSCDDISRNSCGGGGAGFGSQGGRGGNASAATGRGASGGSAYSSCLSGGSGGGGGQGSPSGSGGAGGRGGSCLIINAVGALTVSATGTITANGTAGGPGVTQGGGGGGGSGGVVWLISQTSVTCAVGSVVTCSGGAGGAKAGAFSGGGGGGSSGRRYSWAPVNTLSGTTTLNAAAGGGGGGSGQDGEAGTAGTPNTIVGSPNLPLLTHLTSPVGEQYLNGLNIMHTALGRGEHVMQQRTIASEVAKDFRELAKYLSPDFEGTSAIGDTEGIGNDRS